MWQQGSSIIWLTQLCGAWSLPLTFMMCFVGWPRKGHRDVARARFPISPFPFFFFLFFLQTPPPFSKVACAIIKCWKFHQTLQSGPHRWRWFVSVYDSIIFTANKRENCVSWPSAKWAQGKIAKNFRSWLSQLPSPSPAASASAFPISFFYSALLLCSQLKNVKVEWGMWSCVAAEHVKSVEPKRCGQQLQRSVGVCVRKNEISQRTRKVCAMNQSLV